MIILTLLLITVFSCFSNKDIEEGVVARVGENILTKKNIIDKTEGDLVSSNSVLHLTNNWVEKNVAI